MIYLAFIIAGFWALVATLHLIDANANVRRLQRKVNALSAGRCLYCLEAECDSCGPLHNADEPTNMDMLVKASQELSDAEGH